jgi:hypothetical protein
MQNCGGPLRGQDCFDNERFFDTFQNGRGQNRTVWVKFIRRSFSKVGL